MELENKETADVSVENIGGIEETDVTFSPGVTILEGRNATNRTSLLQALAAACGSDMFSLKGDADEGSVELSLGGETYSQELRRQNGTIRSSGNPYLEDSTLADIFAFLLESNEARQAVARSDDLRDLIMRPIDTDQIRSEIDRLVQERRRIDEELEELDSLKDDLPALEEERTRLQDKIEDKNEALEAKERELADLDADLDETRAAKSELEEKLDELRTKRSDLDDIRYDIETERERLEALIEERTELEARQDDLPEAPTGEISELDSEIERLRTKKQSLQSETNELQSVIGFNEEMLDDADTELFDELQSSDPEALTDQLLDDGSVTCWTCGSDVASEQIRQTIDSLRELNASKFSEITELEERINELKEERQELKSKQRKREKTDRRLDQLSDEITDQEATIGRLEEKQTRLRDEIETLEQRVDELEGDTHNEIVEINKEANQLEYELGRLESERDRVSDEIADIEARLDEQEALKSERAELEDDIQDLRTKIERIEREAVEAFNTHMDTVLDLLNYENLDRIWIERVEKEVREGRRKVSKTMFSLHVIRSTSSGTTYEDTVEHLSESEREVTGLIFALAGYLVHEVYETVPFMLLDSLEAIDSDRIATLIEYFAQYSSYLVVALLPEDAAALDDGFERVREI